ncbi:MAG: hypothetical protein IJ421_00080 [Prevotella sp.]|nr:hypothetical protein [Prevotella sp.]
MTHVSITVLSALKEILDVYISADTSDEKRTEILESLADALPTGLYPMAKLKQLADSLKQEVTK